MEELEQRVVRLRSILATSLRADGLTEHDLRIYVLRGKGPQPNPRTLVAYDTLMESVKSLNEKQNVPSQIPTAWGTINDRPNPVTKQVLTAMAAIFGADILCPEIVIEDKF